MRCRTLSIAALFIASMVPIEAMNAAEIEAYFSPNGGAAAAVAREIRGAKSTIKVQAFSISEAEITAALIEAHHRGINVQLVVNPSQADQTYSTASKIKKAGVQTMIDREHSLMHNKSMVIDEATVVTGSMNFTHSGNKKNAENTLIIRDPALAGRYAADFAKHFDHSQPFIPKRNADTRATTPTPQPLTISKPAHE